MFRNYNNNNNNKDDDADDDNDNNNYSAYASSQGQDGSTLCSRNDTSITWRLTVLHITPLCLLGFWPLTAFG